MTVSQSEHRDRSIRVIELKQTHNIESSYELKKCIFYLVFKLNKLIMLYVVRIDVFELSRW